jgi:hypothetical protein
MYIQMVFLMMNTWCSKHVEDANNWFKTLIWKVFICWLTLTFRVPCIVIYSYNKSQRDALFLKFTFYQWPYMFRTDLLSIIRSLNPVYIAIGICHTSYVDCLLAVASRQSTQLASQIPVGGYTMLRLCLKHVEFSIKINLRNSASRWLLV